MTSAGNTVNLEWTNTGRPKQTALTKRQTSFFFGTQKVVNPPKQKKPNEPA
jgi:hypothetical protein